MGEKAEELHWGGLLWQRGKDKPYFLRDGKDGPEAEIELLFRTRESCEKVIRRMKATNFARAVKRLRENVDPNLEDLTIPQDKSDIPIFAEVAAFEFAVHQNHLRSIRLRERLCRRQSGLSANQHAGNLESEYARAFIDLVGIDLDQLTVRQTMRLEHDCARMRPSNLPINAELTTLAKKLSELQLDVSKVIKTLESIKSFAYPTIPHNRDVFPVCMARDLSFELSQLERDSLVERGSPHQAGKVAERQRDQVLRALTEAWLHWEPFGRDIKDIGFAPPTPSEDETMEDLYDRLIPESQSSGAASNRGVWEFLKEYFERLAKAKPPEISKAENSFWIKKPTAGESRKSVLMVRQDFLTRPVD